MRLRDTILLIGALTGFFASGPSNAHSPHDNIAAVAVAQGNEGQPAIFAIVAKTQLLRSQDGGYFWTELNRGLDNLHLFTDVAASPNTDGPAVVLLASDGDGVFRSDNRGESWTRSSDGLTDLRINKLYMAPDFALSGIAYALSRSGSVFHSSDQGVSWTHLNLDIGPISTIAFKGQGASAGLWLGTANGRIAAASATADDVKVMYDQTASGAIRDISVVPQAGNAPLVLAGTEKSGVLRSEDGGASFAPSNGGLGSANITTVGYFHGGAAEPSVIALGWNEAAFLSNDGGKTWTQSSAGLSTNQQAATPVHYSPQFMDFAVVDRPGGGEFLLIAGFDGFFRSDDNGKSWNQYQVNPPGLFDAMEVSPSRGDDYCVALATYGSGVFRKCGSDGNWQVLSRGLPEWSLHTVTFSPDYARDGELLASGLALYSTNAKSDQWKKTELNYGWFDKASRWLMRQLRSQAGLPAAMTTDLLAHPQPPFLMKVALPPDFSKTGQFYATSISEGILSVDSPSGTVEVLKPRDTFTQDIVLSPDFAQDGTLFVSARDDGIWKSTDRGKTWHEANAGLAFLGAWQAANADASYKGEAEISASYELKLAISPGFASDGTLFAGSSEGIYRSQDKGATWAPVGAGLGPDRPFIAALAISPNFVDDRTLMVNVLGHGLYLSEDGGDTFRPAAAGDDRIGDFRIHLIAFSPRFAEDGRILAASDRHLLESSDRGAHWRVETLPMRIEGARDEIRFDGQWQVMRKLGYSGSEARSTSVAGSRLSVPIHGTGLRVRGSASANTEFVLKIDGKAVPPSELEQANSEQGDDAWIELTGLECTSHLVELELAAASEKNNSKSSLVFDALDVIGNTCDYAQ